MSIESKLKYAVIGTGKMGAYHVNVIKGLSQVDFLGIYDINKERSKTIEKQFNITAWDNLDALLSKVDAITIAVPTSFHFEIAKRLFGIMFMYSLKKPITTNVEQANETYRISKRKTSCFTCWARGKI